MTAIWHARTDRKDSPGKSLHSVNADVVGRDTLADTDAHFAELRSANLSQVAMSTRGSDMDEQVSSRLFSPRHGAFWFTCALIVIGAVVVIPDLFDMTKKPLVATIAVAGGIIQTLLLLLLGWIVLPKGRMHVRLALTAVAVGLTFSIGMGITLNSRIAGGGAATVVAPFVEESAKLVGVFAVLWLAMPVLKGPLDGFVLGFFTGLGFEVLEDITYAFNTSVGASNPASAAFEEMIIRTVNGFGLHNMFTAITGAALAYALVNGGRAWLAVPAGLALSILMHEAWDNLTKLGQWMQVILYAAIVTVFLLVRVRSGTTERRTRVQPA